MLTIEIYLATVLILVFLGVLFDWYIQLPTAATLKEDAIRIWINLHSGEEKNLFINANILYTELFDRIYGKKHLSIRRMAASIVSTSLSIVFVTLAVGYEGSIIEDFFEIVIEFFKDGLYFNLSIWILILLPVFLNFIPDYVSLIETRILMNISRGKNFVVMIFLIFLDIILTTMVFLTGGLLWYAFYYGSIIDFEYAISQFSMDGLLEIASYSLDKSMFLIFYLTTFVTSLLWIIFAITWFVLWFTKQVSNFSTFYFYQMGKSGHVGLGFSAILILITTAVFGIWFGLSFLL